MSLEDLRITLTANYQPDNEVSERLILIIYTNLHLSPKTRKVEYLDDPDAPIPTQDVLLLKGLLITGIWVLIKFVKGLDVSINQTSYLLIYLLTVLETSTSSISS